MPLLETMGSKLTKRLLDDDTIIDDINTTGKFLSEMKDALIGCQDAVIFTVEDVEKAASVICDDAAERVDKSSDEMWELYRNDFLWLAHRVLSVIDGILVDESFTFDAISEEGKITLESVFDTPISEGDTLYLKYGENTDEKKDN